MSTGNFFVPLIISPQQAENRMDYARSLNMAAPLAEQLANSAAKLVQ